MKKLNYNEPIKVGPGIYWIGYGMEKAIFQSNPYLIVDNDEAVLVDPGSLVDFKTVLKKIKKIINPNKIRFIILHHQDSDLCASVPLFEKVIKRPIRIFIPSRSSVFLRYYGIKSEVIPVNQDKVKLKFGKNRILEFYMTPYLHAPGAMVTYDKKSQTLFSSDIFGAFDPDWQLFIEDKKEHLKKAKSFMEPYFSSKKAALYAAKKFNKLKIKKICPQHGRIIDSDTKWWINEFKKMNFGLALKENIKWW